MLTVVTDRRPDPVVCRNADLYPGGPALRDLHSLCDVLDAAPARALRLVCPAPCRAVSQSASTLGMRVSPAVTDSTVWKPSMR